MIKAEILVDVSSRSLGPASRIGIQYDSLETATAEYERVADLLKRHGGRGNDLPDEVSLDGINRFTCLLRDITSIGLCDLEKSNASRIGMSDAYPLLYAK